MYYNSDLLDDEVYTVHSKPAEFMLTINTIYNLENKIFLIFKVKMIGRM